MSRKDEAWAVFWCTLLSPLLFGEVPEAEVGRFLRGLSQQEVALPGGKRGRPSLSTLRRKWKQYQNGGFQGLYRRRRQDRGRPRKASAAMIDQAIALKKEQPRRSDKAINAFLQAQFQRTIPKSTLYRHLKQNTSSVQFSQTRHRVRTEVAKLAETRGQRYSPFHRLDKERVSLCCLVIGEASGRLRSSRDLRSSELTLRRPREMVDRHSHREPYAMDTNCQVLSDLFERQMIDLVCGQIFDQSPDPLPGNMQFSKD